MQLCSKLSTPRLYPSEHRGFPLDSDLLCLYSKLFRTSGKAPYITMSAKTYKNLIDGAWIESRSGQTYENLNPADTRDVIGVFQRSDKRDVDDAVSAAARAFDRWRLVPAPRRAEIIYRAGELLLERKEDYARQMTQEMGKVLNEARGDVQESVDTAYYMAGEGRRQFGATMPSELPNKFAMAVRMPIGVCGMIIPWNFPMAIPSWKLFPALVCGNTCVIKPAEDTPLSTINLVELLMEAGLPDGVVNIVTGFGPDAGAPLVAHPGVRAISFTGSSEVGRIVGQTAAGLFKPCSLEMGGKNAMIVLEDANLDLALEGALWGAFGTTGQRCTATSRIILHQKVHDRFLKMVGDRAQRLRLGSGLDPKTEVGPLIHEEARKKVDYYVGVGKEEGASVVIGGEEPGEKALAAGWFYRPTVLAGVKPGMRVEQEEIFGPILSVIKVTDLAEAIRVNNDVPYGLSSSLYTRDVNAAFQAMEDLATGITYVNAPTVGAEAHLPFGGVKQTGNGHREGGWAVYDFYSEIKVVYVDYSGQLQRAQIDTEICP